MTEALATILFAFVCVATLSLAAGRYRRGVFRMTRDRKMMQDLNPGAWTVGVFDDAVWLARFSKEWAREYGFTWAAGLGPHVWYYYPPESKHGH